MPPCLTQEVSNGTRLHGMLYSNRAVRHLKTQSGRAPTLPLAVFERASRVTA